MLVKLRAHAAAACAIVLVVGTLGPSASAAADLIRGITGCAASAGRSCPVPPVADGGGPGGTVLADGGPTTRTMTLPQGSFSLPASSAPPASMSLPGASTLPGTSTLPAATRPGTMSLPDSTTLPGGSTALPTGSPLPTPTPLPGGPGTPVVAHLPPAVPDQPSSVRPPATTLPAGDTPPPADVPGNGTDTTAQKLGWGATSRVENFDAGLANWEGYTGTGHNGQGLRSPAAATVAGGVLVMSGNAQGTTAGMAWNFGARYGRWEVRMRAPAADSSYHAVMLLWPDKEDWPVGGEVDFAEMSDPTRRTTETFLHYGASNSRVSGSVNIDATQWHNWAVEWTPTGITNYVDGVKWWSTTSTSILPPRSMHLCLQLDWFPEGGAAKPSQMEVDWAAFYPVEGRGASTPPLNSGGTILTTTVKPTTTVAPTTTVTSMPTVPTSSKAATSKIASTLPPPRPG